MGNLRPRFPQEEAKGSESGTRDHTLGQEMLTDELLVSKAIGGGYISGSGISPPDQALTHKGQHIPVNIAH